MREVASGITASDSFLYLGTRVGFADDEGHVLVPPVSVQYPVRKSWGAIERDRQNAIFER